MFAHPERFRRFHAALVARFRGAASVHSDDVRTVQVAYVFEQVEKPRPCGVLFVLRRLRRFEHRLHVEVFDCHHVVFPNEPRRKLVLKVEYIPPDSSLDPCYFLALFLLVV